MHNPYKAALQSGLFDLNYYISTYGAMIEAGRDPLEHYLRYGEAMGFRPSPLFDPVGYKLANEDVSRSGLSPLGHYSVYGHAEKRNPNPELQGLLPGVCYTMGQGILLKGINLLEYDRMTSHQSKLLAQSSSISFMIDDQRYSINSPTADFLLNVIQKNRPFACVRRMHGLWDILSAFFSVEEGIRSFPACSSLSDQEVYSVSERLCSQQIGGCKSYGHVFSENFLREVLNDLSHPPDVPYFLSAVSFKGNPTLDNRLFLNPQTTTENDPHLKKIVTIFSQYFAPAEDLLDGTFLKRGVLSGAYRVLPQLLQEHPVILIGPPWFCDLGKRWNLAQYTHISISSLNATRDRNLILSKCKQILSSETNSNTKKTRKLPVVLFQSSASLAAWFTYRLHADYPDAIYIDFGQALAGWYLDEYFYNAYQWVNIYRGNIVENMRLEEEYKKIAGPHYEEWLASKCV